MLHFRTIAGGAGVHTLLDRWCIYVGNKSLNLLNHIGISQCRRSSVFKELQYRHLTPFQNRLSFSELRFAKGFLLAYTVKALPRYAGFKTGRVWPVLQLGAPTCGIPFTCNAFYSLNLCTIMYVDVRWCANRCLAFWKSCF